VTFVDVVELATYTIRTFQLVMVSQELVIRILWSVTFIHLFIHLIQAN